MSRLLVERSSSGLIVWIGEEERLPLGKHWWSSRSWKIAVASLPGRNCLEAFCSRSVGVQNRLFSDSWMRNWIEVCNGDCAGSLGNESERQNRQVPRTAVMFEQVLLVRKRAVLEPTRPDSWISQSESADGENFSGGVCTVCIASETNNANFNFMSNRLRKLQLLHTNNRSVSINC